MHAGKSGKILLTGTTGFVGGRLLHVLSGKGKRIRCLVRSYGRFRRRFPDVDSESVEGDLLDPRTLPKALEGIETAYYLVHSMGGGMFDTAFAERDRRAAENFIEAASAAGVQRVIYLGGLGEMGDGLSLHLSSRQEVARILGSRSPRATVLRAANIIGSGGAPFEMLRHLVERFPVLIAPRWIDTRCQPIDIYDAVAYLAGCLENEETADAEFDIGGPEIITYRHMMHVYARVRGLKREIRSAPFFFPGLSAVFIGFFTPVPSGVVSPLLEGLRNEVICRENRIREIIPIRLTPLEISICTALQESRGGPGKILSRQSCFLDDVRRM